MCNLYLAPAQSVCYANDNDAFIPEHWAMAGLMRLVENMVVTKMINRDFSMNVASFGDYVHTRRPGNFRVQRKTDADSVNSLDASATDVQVPLDQWIYSSFVIKDGESSKSFQDLASQYLVPGMESVARGIDRAALGQLHRFIQTPAKRAGRLGNLTSTNAKDFVLEAREVLNKNLAPTGGRNLILSPTAETAILKTDLFLSAEQRGDGGSALEEARLGRILGFNTWMAQNVPSLSSGAETVAGTLTTGVAAGTTGSQAVTVTGYEANVGEFCNIAGNDQPTYLTAATASTDTTAITLNEATKYATVDNAVVTVYKAQDVKGVYAVGHTKEIVIDGWAANTAPQVGQMVAFGTGANRRTYTIIESFLSASGEQSILLDRPLEVALADGDLAFPGPYGSLNVALHRDALAMVSRPLALPPSQFGVMSAVANYEDIAMRVTMQYDSSAEGTRVNLGVLCGFALLNADLACLLLG